jgi:hypothetical protein
MYFAHHRIIESRRVSVQIEKEKISRIHEAQTFLHDIRDLRILMKCFSLLILIIDILFHRPSSGVSVWYLNDNDIITDPNQH